jgi:hypothetical protein
MNELSRGQMAEQARRTRFILERHPNAFNLNLERFMQFYFGESVPSKNGNDEACDEE